MGKAARIPSLQPRVAMNGSNVATAVNYGWQDDRRASRHERGYGTAWDKLRLRILERDSYLCQCEDCQGGKIRLRPANQVDHIVSKAEWNANRGSLDGVDHEGNLQAINPLCHVKKTAADRMRAYAAQQG